MSRNPYAPPEAQVGDVQPVRHVPIRAEPPDPDVRPSQVMTAVRLIVISLIVQVTLTLLEWKPVPSAYGVIDAMLREVFSLVVTIALIVALLRGKNWARVLYLVLSVLWLLVAVAATLRVALTPLQGVGLIAQAALTLATVYLLVTDPARPWFRLDRNVP